MHFTIVGRIRNAETIATGRSVRIRKHLIQKFGAGRWRKMTGEATILGRVYFKRKRNLDWR